MHGLLNREYFRAETTHKDDYRVPQLTNEIEDYVICAEKPDPSRKRIPSCPKDYETLKTHGRTIPFNLFYRPKEIVKTNPHTTCIQKIKTGDDQLEYARSLRSRRMFPPAFPVDDLEKMLDDKDVIASIRCYPYWSDYTANFRQFYPMATPKDDATSTLEKKANMARNLILYVVIKPKEHTF